MRIKLLMFLVIFSAYITIIEAQYFWGNVEGIKQFENGTVLLNEGRYSSADSLFSIALCSYKNENVYFNRALARIAISDSVGYCNDLAIAANKYYDDEALKLYHSDCCIKVDSSFLDKNMNRISDKSKYIEILQYPKFNGVVSGCVRKHGARIEVYSTDWSCEGHLIGLNLKRTDMIAAYSMIDSIKHFFVIKNGPVQLKNKIYNDVNSKHLQYFKAKFSDLKDIYDTELFKVMIVHTVNNEGLTGDIIQLLTEPEISNQVLFSEFKSEIQSFISKLPPMKPGKFGDKNVDCIIAKYIEF